MFSNLEDVRVANILSYRDGSLPCDGSRNNFSPNWSAGRDNGRRKLKFRPIHAKTGELRTELCDLRPATRVSVQTANANFIGNLSRAVEFIVTAPPLFSLLFSLPFFRVVRANLYFSINTVQPSIWRNLVREYFKDSPWVTLRPMIGSYEERIQGHV